MKIETPFGPAWARLDASGSVTAFGFGADEALEDNRRSSPRVTAQVAEYFAGSRRTFDLPLALAGTEFQKRVWAELMRIPFAATITYTELARRAGKPGAARAAGRANATNPAALIVPCHRVIGCNGKLTGYAFGMDFKRRLLDWERAVAYCTRNRVNEDQKASFAILRKRLRNSNRTLTGISKSAH